MRLDKNNWKCLWCNTIFQGINNTTALACVMGKKGTYIKYIMFLIKNIYITRYQELQKYKQDRKGVINKYSEKIKAPISSLQDTSSSTIESTIHSSSKSITSSNDINSSEMSSFSYASNITSGINSRNVSNGSLIFWY